MMASPTINVDRLARICGLLGSAHDGERANAAALASREIREAGVTWDAVVRRAFAPVVSRPAPEPQPAASAPDDAEMLRFVRCHLSSLNSWELDFAQNLLARRGSLSSKQHATLCGIYRRIRATRAAY